MRNFTITAALFVLLFIFFELEIISGSVSLDLEKVWSMLTASGDAQAFNIVQDIRLPRAITALFIGADVSIAGLLMQSTFHNPLSGPYILGVSTGACLGVALLTMSGLLIGLGLTTYSTWSLAAASTLGALLTILLVLFASFRIKNNASLLISGMMFGSMITAIISLLQSMANADNLKIYIGWTLGTLDTVKWEHLQLLIPISIIGLVAAWFCQKQLDTLLMGETYAQSLGTNVKLLRIVIVLLTGLLVGISTAFTGPIGFIGTAVPHIARALYKTDKHCHILPASMLIGALILLICDWMVHQSDSGYILPINAICALIGTPVIVFIAIKRTRI